VPQQALSLQCYRDPRIGGLQCSLCNHADEAFYSLTPEQQRIAEKMFRNLCDLDNEGKWTRRWMKLDEIAAVAGIGREQWQQVVPVVEAFICEHCNFLIASPEGPFRADTTIDISHEALIRQWKRMQGWLRKEQESVQQYRRLLDTARRWKLGEAGLWGSPDLDVVLKWRDAERPSFEWPNRCGGDFELAQEFLQSSVAAREQQRQEAEERRQAREREIAAQKAQLEALQQKERERNELQKTRRGRAELMLAERAELWTAKHETRRLPNVWEYLTIQIFTSAANRSEPQRQMMHAANRYHVIQAGLIVTALLLVWWGTAEVSGRFQARALHDQFLDAEIDGVPDIIKRMAPYRRWLEPRLKQDFQEALANKDRRRQLYIGLALLPTDPAQVPIVYEQLLEAHASEVAVVRDALAPHKDGLLDQLWAAAERPAPAQSTHRLRAAAALAAYDPNNPRWAKVQGQLAKEMVGEPGGLLEYWVKALRPVREKLQGPLSAIFRDPAWRETERSMATDVLAEYAKDQPDILAELLLDADAKQFGVLFPAFQKHGERGLERLRLSVRIALLAKAGPVTAPASSRVQAARQQANAAIALLRMGHAANVWPLLKFQADPTLRSFLIHRLGPMGADPNAVVNRFEAERDVTIQRALVQCLGEPGEKALADQERDAFVGKLKLATNSDDPGLRASAEWLLRLWGHGAWLKTQEEAWRNDKEKRTERFEAVRKRLGQDDKPPPQWYLTSQGQTMVVLPGDIDFMMGSPESEEGRFTSENEDAEALHRVRINRNVAIGATPVTVEQYRRFNKGHKVTRTYAPSDDCPVHNVSWADAANYCNWLSDRDGIHPDQRVYYWTDKGELRMKPNYLSLTGYRLPTSAESEYACRAETTTSRYFGDATDLLGKYAWHLNNAKLHSGPVASLKPNDFGLFDMHGNVWCWCQDRYEKSRGHATVTDAEDEILTVAPNKDRVMRGGAFVTLGSVLRSASSDVGFPPSQRGSLGFRVARTINAAR
jgi:formylglycine-generating enzyme required for sulfatase activity